MGGATITISGAGVRDINELSVEITIEAVVNISAKEAQRHATGWLVSEIGNMLIAGDPQLVIGETTCWRLPILLTSSTNGVVARLGYVDVDGARIPHPAQSVKLGCRMEAYLLLGAVRT